MKIAINTRLVLQDQMDGMGWFMYETTRLMVQSHPEVQFHLLYDRRPQRFLIEGANVINHVIHPQARHSILQRIWHQWSVRRVLKRIKPDCYLSADAQLTLGLNIPTVLVIHDINFEHYPEDIPAHFSRYLRKYSPLFARAARRLVTVSTFSAQDIAARYGVSREMITVIPNGVNASFRPLSESEKAEARRTFAGGHPYFIFVGSIHPRKNLHRLVQAFDLFKKQTGSDARLVIAGNLFYMHDELKTAMDNLSFRKDIIEVGRMDDTTLGKAIGGAMANVYVSYFEGFGIPVLEGFRCGVPVIAGNRTAIPEVAGDAALLVDPLDIHSIADGLIRISSDEKFREELINKGIIRGKDFSWEKTATELWQVILSTQQR